MSTTTRLYFPSTGTPSISPTFNSLWDVTSGADRISNANSKGGTGMALKSVSISGFSTGTKRYLARQYVSSVPLGALSLTGVGASSISGHAIIMCKTDYTGTHCRIRTSAALRVCDSTGAIRVNGSTIGGGTPDIISSATLINRNFLGFNFTYPVTIHAGDFLMYEIGISVSLLSGSQDINGSTVWIDFGEALADLPNNVTNTVEGSPWMDAVAPSALFPSTGGNSGTKIVKPFIAVLANPSRFQFPPVADRTGDILNEFIL
jgi:hypothetical protein